MLGGGISSKMNVPRLSAEELILQPECLKQLLIQLEENNYVNVERPCPWLFDCEEYGSSPLAKPPARSYWLILIVLLNLPNLFQLPGLARMYARDGVVMHWSKPLVLAHTTLLEISYCGPFIDAKNALRLYIRTKLHLSHKELVTSFIKNM